MPYCWMLIRDNWIVDLRCPACGANGAAEVSEDERPIAMSEGTLRVDKLPDGFRVRNLGSTMLTTKFECVLCRELTI
jgi:hypothetical protein